jgi:hypothetical protein
LCIVTLRDKFKAALPLGAGKSQVVRRAGCVAGNGTGRGFTHQSVISTTFCLYRYAPTGMMTACDEMGAVLIIGRWNPFA